MLIENLYASYTATNPNAQFVLQFSNNNLVLLTEESFAAFMQHSKVRHTEQFSLAESSDDMDIYRTNRGLGKCDYVLFVNKGDYMVLPLLREHCSRKYKSVVRKKRPSTDEVPAKLPVIHAYPYAYDDEVVAFFSFDGQDMVYEKSYPRLRTNPEAWMPKHHYAMAVIRVMSTLVENDKLNEGIKELIIHNGQTVCDVRHTWRMLLGKHEENMYGCISYWDKRLEDEFNHLKARLQLRGITVAYKSSLPLD